MSSPVLDTNPQPARQDSAAGCLLRMFWMMGGNAVLFICLAAIVVYKLPWFSAIDAAFWGAVALIIAARYLDTTRYSGQDSDGQPATLAGWRRHALTTVAVGAVLWAVAHAISRASGV